MVRSDHCGGGGLARTICIIGERQVLRHDLRNRLAAARNAATYIRKRLSKTDVWQSDPRLERFADVIDTEIAAANELLSRMLRLLVVDDSESNRLVLAGLLEDEGHEVDVAASFADGRAKLADDRPAYDLVLLDQHLGDGLGTDLVPLVKQRAARTKILLLSGSGAGDARLGDLAIDGVLTKGDDFSELLATIEKLAPAARSVG
jgi:CheY-like chemotaxis protein